MKLTVRYLIGCILLTGLAFSAFGQDDLPYNSGSTGADGALQVPRSLPNRYHMAYAYDAARNRIVCLSGYDRGESPVRAAGWKPETWLFDGAEWTQAQPATFVSARQEAAMVYDPVRQEVVMFGGWRPDNVYLNETWTWNGTNWTLKAPAASPPARYRHVMVWDPVNERVILFGGEAPGTNFTDVWAWNGTTWTELSSETPPQGGNYGAQHHQAMAWETSKSRVILYNEAYRKTWTYNGTGWTEISTAEKPNVGAGPRMEYDEVRGEIILVSGSTNNQTWAFKDDEWFLKAPATAAKHRWYHGLVWCTAMNKIIIFGGDNHNNLFQSTQAWDGTNWASLVDRVFLIDMSAKPNGIWHHTTIHVPPYVDVRFGRNAGNTPVTLLATGNALIEGQVILNGEDGPPTDFSGIVAKAGPGGFDGGLGGIRFDVSGTYAGTPGQGPGGGEAPTEPGVQGGGGRYSGVYGNSLIQPMIGGSGGGGGSSTDDRNGGNGGGGGGGLLLASSRDVIINGKILANGGHGNWGGTSYGGGGSGGAVRVVADRITGSGAIEARAGNHGGSGAGRVRLEAYFRPFAPNTNPVPSATAPVDSINFANQPTLAVTNVAGEVVAQPPSGSFSSPDAVFTQAGDITVTVQGTNIPAGTPVTLRITTTQGVISLPGEGQADVTLNAGGTASFTTAVPAGPGTIQAFAQFSLVAP